MNDQKVPDFRVSIAGIRCGNHSNATFAYYNLYSQMKIRSFTETENGFQTEYFHPKHKFSVTVCKFTQLPGEVIRQLVTIKNESENDLTITHLSSVFLGGIASNGKKRWDYPGKVKIHYCLQAWEGEGQWRVAEPEEVGIIHTSANNPYTSFHISSVGSWSTSKFTPVIMIEDTETEEIWYSQIETSTSWHCSVGYIRNETEQDGSLYIQMDAADEKYGGFRKKLLPGEIFTTQPVIYGNCKGSFEEAVKKLTKYRRNYLLYINKISRDMPLFFNDYMNCLWADPSIERLLPLIDKASEAGAEGFCIDAGWFSESGCSWTKMLGDWETDSNRFGENGIKGILDYIKGKGMIPGLWLEMEVCGEASKISKSERDFFLHREGEIIGGEDRFFMNFSNRKVREYIHKKIDKLVEMGVGFIKNDYNDCVGIGVDNYNSSSGYGLIMHSLDFFSFIDEVRAKHPDLIIENCASGAMRQDYGILSHFHMQSMTDQEWYYKMPSIITGSSANILPEQSGIWAYPVPVLGKYRLDEKYIYSKDFLNSFTDGEQTIFNMVNGLCGLMYISGRIDLADEKNFSLIADGMKVFKNIRNHVRNSFPVWPTGMMRFNNDEQWGSFGLINESKTYMTLAIWKLKSQDNKLIIKLPYFKDRIIEIKQIYPNNEYDVITNYNNKSSEFEIEIEGVNKARYFEIKVSL